MNYDLLNHINESAEELRALNLDRLCYKWVTLDGRRNPQPVFMEGSVADKVDFVLDWGTSKTATLIAGRIAVGATHYKMDRQLNFLSPRNVTVAVEVNEHSEDLGDEETDVQLGLLDYNVESSITPHKILGDIPRFKPLLAIFADKEGKANFGVGQLHDDQWRWDRETMDEIPIPGDSGNPTYAVYKEDGEFKLALICVHWRDLSSTFLGSHAMRQAIVEQCQKWSTDPPEWLDEAPGQPTPDMSEGDLAIIDAFLAERGLARLESK